MKAVITKVTFNEDRDSRYGGKEYSFTIEYDNKKAYHTSKDFEQSLFVEGVESEFREEQRESKAGNKYLVVKAPGKSDNSNYGRQLKREQSRYTTMGTSYCKDLIISGHLDINEWQNASKKIVLFMYNLDKELEK